MMARRLVGAIAALLVAGSLSACGTISELIPDRPRDPTQMELVNGSMVEVELRDGRFIDCELEVFTTISSCDFGTLRTTAIEGRERFPFIKTSTTRTDPDGNVYQCVTELNTQVGQALMCDPQPSFNKNAR